MAAEEDVRTTDGEKNSIGRKDFDLGQDYGKIIYLTLDISIKGLCLYALRQTHSIIT